jgi:hypothetical protein
MLIASAPVVILQRSALTTWNAVKSNWSWRAANKPLNAMCRERHGCVLLLLFAKRKRGILLRKTAAGPAADPARADTNHCVTRRQSLVLAKAKGRYGDAAFCVFVSSCALLSGSLSVIPSRDHSGTLLEPAGADLDAAANVLATSSYSRSEQYAASRLNFNCPSKTSRNVDLYF